jgi:hypothetical protein
MDDDNPFSFYNRDDPIGEWPFQSPDLDSFDAFTSGTTGFDAPLDPVPPVDPAPFDLQFPAAAAAPAPAPAPDFCRPARAAPPARPPPPRAQRPTDPHHKKVASATHIFIWGARPSFRRAPARGASLFAAPAHMRQNSLPEPAPAVQLESDAEFAQVCADASITFNPARLGFIPSRVWQDRDVAFGQLVSDFFQRKNNANSRFSHKLFNALRITLEDAFYVEFVGLEWVTDRVLRIDKRVFARLLGIKVIDGSLFHQQGNFPSHGFVELSEANAREYVDAEMLAGVDFENVRLLVHQDGTFRRDCTEADIERCRWTSARKRNLALQGE